MCDSSSVCTTLYCHAVKFALFGKISVQLKPESRCKPMGRAFRSLDSLCSSPSRMPAVCRCKRLKERGRNRTHIASAWEINSEGLIVNLARLSVLH